MAMKLIDARLGLLLLLGTLTLWCTCSPVNAQVQPGACATIKEGRFEISDEKTGVSIITRKGGIQREENEQMGVVIEYLTDWIDECSFRLVPFKVVRNDNNLELDADLKLIVEIIEVREGLYIQETTAWATGQYQTEEVKIIK
jgi:hypothetical protein